MKDRQVQPSPPQPRVFLISAALHCISMMVIVFLRSSFGLVYLRHKSVFLACSWAFVLYSIYAWNEPQVWAANRFLCIYGVTAVILYCLHLCMTVVREIRRTGKHDSYSGNSHLKRFLPSKFARKPSIDWHLRLWVEPVTIAIAALIFCFMPGGRSLSTWLLIAAPSLAAKEALNYWFDLRQPKRMQDQMEDSRSMFDEQAEIAPTDVPKATRKGRTKLERVQSAVSSPADVEAQRHHEILRLMPGASLEQAEINFRTLIKDCHPDATADSPANNAHAAALNEAIQFMRRNNSE